MRRSRTGFTLVELMVAVILTALVALLGHRLLSTSIITARELGRARLSLDRQSNASRWLRGAFRSLEMGDETSGFKGTKHEIRFTSWLREPEGWFTRRDVALRVQQRALIARISGAPAVVLDKPVDSLSVDYLLEPGAASRWTETWISPLSAPVAVRLRVARDSARVDTLLFLIGDRG